MQEWTVAVIVVLAAAYAVWYWLPAGWRRPLGQVHKTLGQMPGCNDCSRSCGGCAKADPMPGPEVHSKPRTIPIVSQPHSRR